MSDEGDVADEAVADGAENADSRGSGGRTALVTKPVVRPQRPTGKRSRSRAGADADVDVEEPSTAASEATGVAKDDSTTKAVSKAARAKKASKPKARSVNPIAFVYNYLKQVVAEMRKVIWPNRKQMLTYTSVVLAFLAFMVALVAGADLGLTKLVMLVFG
ncbi:Putative preprotein translocase SecE1 [Mycobacterium canettii CIPT 140060008]|uniref:Protein translocase subunit SecE n=2 Tax=Mycobacterium canetti TaxID=78331 RepID=A0ABV1M901_9MYCO|nr:preprotein translocase subunit SecE [Mycobacterium canetti]MBA2785294.1 preprotein translocase subunit SecE [Mycobacterium canetti]MBC9074579.1 preprotein translocase subunit SecE [Mycobacterium canetti]CCC42977.1 putative preprotein translocase SECE1 [Mycobacterium canettii CIPT 140010059]CCK50557.1 Putative preprotein translocase SecE1 [Mycobacterium canettii CIPT 140060008]CCK54585.1 Putative preprotein translocase SecE1 [Mycobacterium canettii CIPT 140070008]